MSELRYLDFNGDYITLAQFLKMADIISSGGEAKLYLASNPVLVNGVREDRRGRKLVHGDLVVVSPAQAFELREVCR